MSTPTLGRLALLSALALALATAARAADAPAVKTIKGKGAYAVVVSEKTYADPAWRAVVDALVEKHAATVLVYPGDVADARPALAEVFPRHACFVARPEEAGRRFVMAIHRLTRALDDDPYTDCLWGILTGYDAADAVRIARHKEPLVVRRGTAGCGLNLDVFDEGVWYSEGEKGVMHEKRPGGKDEKKQCPDDTTQALVDVFNQFKPDLFMTSGHATQRDWQIGYSYRNGQFRCKEGQLLGVDLGGKTYPIRSPNPKVYLPCGNCLIGEIPDRECMALAFMRTGGVYQMIGYTVSTWFGYGGWGVKELFVDQPGRFTLSEAFYLNEQSLLYRLQSRYPKSAAAQFDDPEDIGRKFAGREKDEAGLLWDRDTVAFYGDPAWEARLVVRPSAWEQTLTEKGGVYTFEVVANRDVECSRPPMALLPRRVRNVEIVEGKDLAPLVTDNFVLLPNPAKLEKGKSYKVAFKAQPAQGKPESARPAFEPTENFVARDIEGWKVLVHKRLLDEKKDLGAETLKVLQMHLYDVSRMVPAAALAKLRQVAIWVEADNPEVVCMCYHPSKEWLTEHGFNPGKAGCVELGNPKNFLDWTHHQRAMVLHELAHAYHHQVLGYDNPDIKAAFKKAQESKSYESVLFYDGSKKRAYALENDQEYFAELAEAYFSTNDFYPFVRPEVRDHDPLMFETLKKLWGK